MGIDARPADSAGRFFHIIVFAAVITVTIYVIIDLEFPCIGIIRINATDRLLVDLRKKMG